jgi:hypothetical protein
MYGPQDPMSQLSKSQDSITSTQAIVMGFPEDGAGLTRARGGYFPVRREARKRRKRTKRENAEEMLRRRRSRS